MKTSPYPVVTAGAHTYVDTDPDSTESPVVLLHGMIGDVSNWDNTVLELARYGRRVIVPKLPIYSIARKEAELAGLVRYLGDFFRSVNIPTCTLGGNSMGGQLAVLFAVSNPHRVENLLLSGASGIIEVDLGSSIMRRNDRAYLRDRIERTFFDPVHCTGELVEQIVQIINNRENAVRLISFARSVQREGIGPLLSDLEIPTLIIWGKDDQITPVEVAHTLNMGITNSTLVVIDECGHAPMMERPARFNEALLDFLIAAELQPAEIASAGREKSGAHILPLNQDH